jgi:glycoprotein-N-acetylgalactosamine 3-beta-galactosyltransferase
MRETWAGGCDGFLAFSTESDPRLPAMAIQHDGPEEYDNMWQKSRSIWKFVGKHYIDDFDWFFLGGDDLFVMPHNLKTYLASLMYKDKADPKVDEYYVGRRFSEWGETPFNSGGAGYTLSRATLRKFLTVIDDEEHCSAKKHTCK